MSRSIYLEFDEEVVSALQKIRKSGDDEVVVVIPRGAKIMRSLTTLKLLREQAAHIGKSISCATADEQGKLLLKRAGIPIATSLAEKPESEKVIRVSGRNGMGDIVLRPLTRPVVSKPGSADQAAFTKAEQTPAKPVSKSKKLAARIEPEPVADDELSELIGPTKEEPRVEIEKPPRRIKAWMVAVIVVVVALVIVSAGIGFYVLPKAEIILTPRKEAVTKNLELLVDSQVGVPDIQTLTIPGKKFSEELSDSKSYQATGIKQVGEKASGFVNIYNFSKNSLILKTSTTRLEVKGKVFYFLQDVGSIRPTGRIGPDLEVDPDSLISPVAIVAAQPGQDYNLPEGSRFEIFNEVFGHQSEVLYAVNANPIAGGTNKEVKMVSEADVIAARSDLSNQMLEKFRSGLREKLTADSLLAEHATRIEVTEENVSPAVGTQSEQFQLKQKIKVNSLTYSQSDLRDIFVGHIVRLLPKEKSLIPSTDKDLQADFVSLDSSVSSGTLRAHFESEIVYNLSTEYLSRGLYGKTESQVKDILLARPEIHDVKVEFWPFWVNTVPKFDSKINIKVAK